jgi:large subunit ribosomal protein L3
MTTQSTSSRSVTALLGKKLGMTQAWDDSGRVIPITAIEVDVNVVTQVRTQEVDSYCAVQLAYGEVNPRKVTKPLAGHFAKAGVTPRRHLVEFRTANADDYSLGQEIAADAFAPGAMVDVTGTTKGKGTAGVMKRHGFAGVGASHGAHRNHRKPGSIGACATPGRVFKGMRMAGRMGAVRQTVQNLTVVAVDAAKGLVLVKGAVPGPRGGVVLIRSAVKGA